MAAVARPDVNVTVQRRDLELLLLTRVDIDALQTQVPTPQLHPEQR